MKQQPPKTVLCLHDFSALGRAGLAAILPALCAVGVQPVALPTVLLSSHTGGLGAPAALSTAGYLPAALAHYQTLGVSFDFIYSGYLSTPDQAALVQKAHELWPNAMLVVDPVLGDDGKLYSGQSEESVTAMHTLCGMADLVLPNFTEAGLLLGQGQNPAACTGRQEALEIAERIVRELGAKNCIITGIVLEKSIACAGAGRESFFVEKAHIARHFPGTGDLFGAVLVGCLASGNALSAAADAAAAFVADCILATPEDADPRLGVWSEAQLWRLAKRGGLA